MVSDQDRMRFDGDQFYLRTEDEMRYLFSDIPEAVDNTMRIAGKCDFHFDLKSLGSIQGAGGRFFPKYPVTGAQSGESLLRSICEEGFSRRYGKEKEVHRERLEYELSVIESMGFTDYFLIVWDFIRYAKENGIAVGPGRGSAAGSIVSYVLEITDVDPMRYGLIFERFLNPERTSMPDIDVDFCIERRGEVIEYVRGKYGEGNVAQIITFGTLQARQVIKDVGRALGVALGDVDRLLKALPPKAKNLSEAFSGKSKDVEGNVIRFKEDSDKFARKVMDGGFNNLMEYAKILEGKPRQPGTHAAGVVISGNILADSIPLWRTKDGGMSVQYTMNTVEDLGFLKMDFLGLRNLTLIRHAIDIVKANRGVDIDMSALELDDPKVFELIGSGQTEGVFQLEGGGMQGFMMQLRPKRFEDIIVGISMYRPGPMKDIPDYLDGRKKSRSVCYLHPKLKPILEDTYGVMVYQEQVMQIVRDLAGFSFGESDEVRRGMSKKKLDTVMKARDSFVKGCMAHGIPEKDAEKIGDQMVSFASYAFNKSHAAVYAVLAYQTAYLKTYYREEFMAALMSSVMNDRDKVIKYIQSARDMGLRITPPDIRRAGKEFTVDGEEIIMGLGSVKNVGSSAIDTIIEARNHGGFSDMYDFVTTVDGSIAGKRVVESLIMAGAFDGISENRAQMMHEYVYLSGLANEMKKLPAGQTSMFDASSDLDIADRSSGGEVSDYPGEVRMEREKEMLGLYFSAHPLDSVKWVIDRIGASDSYRIKHPEEFDDSMPGEKNSKQVLLVGIMSDVRMPTISKGVNKGKQMAIFNVEDYMGVLEVVMFSRECAGSRDLIASVAEEGGGGRIVVVRGAVYKDPDKSFPVIHASKVTAIEEAADFFKRQDLKNAEMQGEAK
jgi:DNA polymerase-3 subunit alpha